MGSFWDHFRISWGTFGGPGTCPALDQHWGNFAINRMPQLIRKPTVRFGSERFLRLRTEPCRFRFQFRFRRFRFPWGPGPRALGAQAQLAPRGPPWYPFGDLVTQRRFLSKNSKISRSIHQKTKRWTPKLERQHLFF